ncbi:DUF3450 family protein [Salinisphaera sp. G21_0]|uniref:DUF3450 domain-containing protein n=1 Tax=Salinisphaera sp. G21_0 TaxID=2821094 RepID=UPI001ADB39B2|nr:DUF3450 domain-containing protein [Salinisphaera sp. G21_0]
MRDLLAGKRRKRKSAVAGISRIQPTRYLPAMLLALGVWGNTLASSSVNDLTTLGQQRIEANQQAQKTIEAIDDETDRMETRWFQQMKQLEGLKVYNRILLNQVDEQQREMAEINASIERAVDIERQVIPLIDRMITGLEQFIRLDVPFLQLERRQRLDNLKSMLNDPDVATADKLANVFAAYREENKYGRTIEAYRGEMVLDNQTLPVEFLRIGRVALLYQTPAKDRMGAWNPGLRQWVSLNPSEYRRQMHKGIQIARKQIAPDLLEVPVFQIESVKASAGGQS